MELKNKLSKIKKDCILDNIPIIRDKTLQFILNFVSSHNIKTILEIGTAYGYSSFAFKIFSNIEKIISLEKNKFNYEKANYYLEYMNISDVKFINIDAFEYFPNEKFDLIFMDGPKGNQIKLFEKYVSFLNPNGYIIIDNLYLNKIRLIDDNLKTKNQKSIIFKLDNFINYLKNIENYNFSIIEIDDGIGVVSKNEESKKSL